MQHIDSALESRRIHADCCLRIPNQGLEFESNRGILGRFCYNNSRATGKRPRTTEENTWLAPGTPRGLLRDRPSCVPDAVRHPNHQRVLSANRPVLMLRRETEETRSSSFWS